MSKAQHTQGPWNTGIGKDADQVFAQQGNTAYEIADCGMLFLPIETRIANARLIAAAPESHESNIWLLDAVRLLIAGKPVRDLEERIAFAEKAIAKAKGEQP